ncbi:hypothetical protein RI054_24g103530 [Pseudoscourfieldia marina]
MPTTLPYRRRGVGLDALLSGSLRGAKKNMTSRRDGDGVGDGDGDDNNRQKRSDEELTKNKFVESHPIQDTTNDDDVDDDDTAREIEQAHDQYAQAAATPQKDAQILRKPSLQTHSRKQTSYSIMDVLLASVLSSVMTIMVVLFLTTTTPQKTTMVTKLLPSLAQQQKDKATCEAWDLLVENEIDEVLVPERKPSPILEEYRRLSSPFQTDTFDNLQQPATFDQFLNALKQGRTHDASMMAITHGGRVGIQDFQHALFGEPTLAQPQPTAASKLAREFRDAGVMPTKTALDALKNAIDVPLDVPHMRMWQAAQQAVSATTTASKVAREFRDAGVMPTKTALEALRKAAMEEEPTPAASKLARELRDAGVMPTKTVLEALKGVVTENHHEKISWQGLFAV